MTTPTRPVVVALCMPIANKIDPLFFRSYRFLDRSMAAGWHHFDMVGWPVDQARNEITHAALQQPDITHLLWIDDDMVFPPHALQRLLSHNERFVGGLCFDRRHPYKPVIAKLYDPSWGFEPNTLGWLFDYPPDTLFKVDATGGAFLLVAREVFELIRENEVRRQAVADGDLTNDHVRELRQNYKRWWTPQAWQGASEDLSFCARAREVGVQIHVDTGLKIGHVGEVVVDEGFARHNRQFEYQRWHPPYEALLDAARTRPIDEAPVGIVDLDLKAQNPRPIASIVIPVYNQRPEFLLHAVRSALTQTAPVEVIVVDDGSEHCLWCGGPAEEVRDGVRACSAACAGAPRGVKVIHHAHNQGISAALNTGIRVMSADWFCWLSSDDFYEPEKVERHLSAILCAGAKASYTGYNIKFDNGNRIGHVALTIFPTREAGMEVLRQRCAINGSTVMLHRSIFQEIGLFDPEFKYGQDWEFWCRVGEQFHWFGIPDKLTTRREFGNLTERLNKAEDPQRTAQRNAEDLKIRTRYRAR